jgi:phosphoserine phosphatase
MIRSSRAPIFLALLVVVLAGVPAPTQPVADPLPSWNETDAKLRIRKFVAAVTDKASPDYVPVEQRVATFDNDGTLWTEQPMYVEVVFSVDRLRAMARRQPELRDKPRYKEILASDPDKPPNLTGKEMMEIIAITHAGMTTEEFDRLVKDWLATHRHPRFKRPYTELVYQPMLELLSFLRATGFQTYIVSGGGVDFMRAFAEQVYGIRPEQVVGTSIVTRYEMRRDGPVLLRLPEFLFNDNFAGKPEGIERHIGRRPFTAFGNSDGDQQMLEWTAAGGGARLMGLVHHDDAVREYAYDRNSEVGQLDKAWDEAVRRNWLVVSMKNDWRVIYPFERK